MVTHFICRAHCRVFERSHAVRFSASASHLEQPSITFVRSSRFLYTVPGALNIIGTTRTSYLGHIRLTSQTNLSYHSFFRSSLLHNILPTGLAISMIQHSVLFQLKLCQTSNTISHSRNESQHPIQYLRYHFR